MIKDIVENYIEYKNDDKRPPKVNLDRETVDGKYIGEGYVIREGGDTYGSGLLVNKYNVDGGIIEYTDLSDPNGKKYRPITSFTTISEKLYFYDIYFLEVNKNVIDRYEVVLCRRRFGFKTKPDWNGVTYYSTGYSQYTVEGEDYSTNYDEKLEAFEVDYQHDENATDSDNMNKVWEAFKVKTKLKEFLNE